MEKIKKAKKHNKWTNMGNDNYPIQPGIHKRKARVVEGNAASSENSDGNIDCYAPVYTKLLCNSFAAAGIVEPSAGRTNQANGRYSNAGYAA